MDKFDWFKNEFENLSDDEQIEIFNRYCEENSYEDEIYPMDMFDEIFEAKKPSEVFQMVQANSGDVNYTNKFFIVTIYGFQTFNDPYEIIQYYISSLLDCEHLWERYINIDDYIEDMYDGHFDMKPEDMDDDTFYDIVEDAVYSNDREKDIVECIKKTCN